MSGDSQRTGSVVFLTQTFPRFPEDTAGPFIREIGAGLVRAGWRVRVLAPHAEGVPARWQTDGLDVETFRYAPESLELVGYSRSLERDETVRGGAAISAPLYLLGARRALQRALRAESTDVVHAHWIVPNGLALPGWGRDLRRADGGRTVCGYGLHGSDVFLAEKPGVRRAVRSLLGRGSFLTGCSPELVQRVAALGDGSIDTAVIPYGVDSERFCPDPDGRRAARQRLGLADGDVVALGVGRMATKKGFQVLLERCEDLFERAPANFHLVLAGGGDREEEFRRRVSAAGIDDRVHFPGLVERDLLPSLFAAADLFVLPAVHDAKGNVDGLPNVILEAMASGLPVVATGISGIPLAIVPEETGLLVGEGEIGPLYDAIVRLAEQSELRARWGAAGRERVIGELSWDRVAGRYADAYRVALSW